MAANANRVSPARIPLSRINNCSLALRQHMLSRIPVTSLARNSRMQERQAFITIDRSGVGVSHRTHVTSHAAALHRKWRRRLRNVGKARLHVVAVRGRVPGNRRLEQVIAYRVEIGSSKVAGTEKVSQGESLGSIRRARRQ